MKNREKLHNRALYDLMITKSRCKYKNCPMEMVGERKHECVAVPEGLAQTDCDRCIQAWLNEEVKT